MPPVQSGCVERVNLLDRLVVKLGGGWREGRKGPIQECQGKV